ncbi:transcriptional initiation protein Tat, partial [Stenotrophomonas maltophilia]
RRHLLKTGGVLAGALMIPGAVSAGMRQRSMPESLLPPDVYPGAHPAARAAVAAQPAVRDTIVAPGVNRQLMQRAMAALDRHGSR